MLVGFVVLIWSADKLVAGAAAVANSLQVPKLVIGLTVVSIGTSAPEILVAVLASLDGAPTIAIGNAIGSNIANIGLVLGLTALLVPLPFEKSVLREEMPWLLLATLLTGICLFNFHLGLIDGIFLLILLGVGMYRLVVRTKNDPALGEAIAEEVSDLTHMSLKKAWFWLLLGLLFLLLSAQVVVVSAIEIATIMGVAPMVISLTVIAIGTSLPELAATITAAVKKHPEIAIGNVVGSNILNLLAVLPVPALMLPSTIHFVHYYRDVGVMVVFTILLALFAYGFRSQKIITRMEGLIFFLGYLGYLTLLVKQSLW